MRPTCLICGKEFESTRCVGNGDMQKFWICDSCFADAALGRAVRKMPAWTFLYQNSIGWFSGTEMTHGTRTYGPKCDTPEAALQAVGLMEVEG